MSLTSYLFSRQFPCMGMEFPIGTVPVRKHPVADSDKKWSLFVSLSFRGKYTRI